MLENSQMRENMLLQYADDIIKVEIGSLRAEMLRLVRKHIQTGFIMLSFSKARVFFCKLLRNAIKNSTFRFSNKCCPSVGLVEVFM